MNISYCNMVTEFPDVSEAKNLRELRLDGCEKLATIHESVGLLGNLVFLSASECNLLTKFVPTMYLPSLEYLSLNLCTKLAFFPEISGTMNSKLKINMLDTAIKKLPESIEKLTGLNSLEMTDCKELQHIPSTLFTLPNFVTLKVGGCRRLRESFTRIKGSDSVHPKLETLHFDNAYLSDEEVRMIMYHFPNLKELNISCNPVVHLPACIKESTNLTSLHLRYCHRLQEIPALPSSVQKVDAKYCYSLTSKSSNIMWSQVCKEMKRLEVAMPKKKIPEWFDHVNEGGIPFFNARKKLSAVALALVFGEVDAKPDREIMEGRWRTVGMHLFIEGERRRYHNFSVAENHVLLCDLRVLFNLEERGDLGFGVGKDWKSIQVFCETNLSLCSWGVYVYKTETNMEDIKFTSEDPGSSLVWSDDQIISDMHKIASKKISLNLPEMHREFRIWRTGSRKHGSFKDGSSRDLEKASRRVMALREEEGGSGMNIEDEKNEEVDSLLDMLATAELDKHFHQPSNTHTEPFTLQCCCQF
ncbi:uncharacterized protein LOC114169250 [Vigna unguiculata]|uniref:uncharacterized protein LOC114169250 n=1 Tax=Vigna unguiculata TaxID=3917 RepID=UPI001016798C|nr:uncharacterized protein LOC114169250 [Vigna unguiculata]